MRTVDEIRSMYAERVKDQAPIVARMIEVRDTYNGDVVVPLPELESSEQSSVANLVQQGLDQTAMRIASTIPNVFVPPIRPGIKVSERKAQIRRDAILGWWAQNRVQRKIRRRARWLIGYGCAPVILRPDAKRRIPRWDLRDPLQTYPAPGLDVDELVPPDCIFAFTRSEEWVHATYPQARAALTRGKTRSGYYNMLEYVDADELVLVAVGASADQAGPWVDPATVKEVVVELERVPNRTGSPLAVVPGRVTLDRLAGQFDGLLGMYAQQAELMALNILAIKRGIFPETWIISAEGRVADVQAVPDTRTGEPGRVAGGTVTTIQPQPGVYTNPTIDRLEYGMRQSGGIPSELGGQSGTNIRTGRRGEQVLSAALDFTIQEAQETFEQALECENRIGFAIAKGYFGPERVTIFLGSGARSQVEYTADDDFETDEHTIRYAYAGADAAGLNIIAGQKLGMGTLSKQTAMAIDPMVLDVESEQDQIVAEGLEAAFMASIQTQAANPEGPWQPADMARLVELVKSDRMELFEAVQTVQEEAQARQAEQAPPGAPETMPGLSIPGQGVEAGQQQPPVEPGLNDLRMRLVQLRSMAASTPEERAVVQPGAR